MSLSRLIRDCVAVADRVTMTLQCAVTHEAWIAVTGHYGAPSFAAAVSRQSIVDYSTRLVRDMNGQEVPASITIMILRPISANGASGRREPVDPRDRFILPDGTTGPVLNVGPGGIDPSTGRAYFAEVYLG